MHLGLGRPKHLRPGIHRAEDQRLRPLHLGLRHAGTTSRQLRQQRYHLCRPHMECRTHRSKKGVPACQDDMEQRQADNHEQICLHRPCRCLRTLLRRRHRRKRGKRGHTPTLQRETRQQHHPQHSLLRRVPQRRTPSESRYALGRKGICTMHRTVRSKRPRRRTTHTFRHRYTHTDHRQQHLYTDQRPHQFRHRHRRFHRLLREQRHQHAGNHKRHQPTGIFQHPLGGERQCRRTERRHQHQRVFAQHDHAYAEQRQDLCHFQCHAQRQFEVQHHHKLYRICRRIC